MIFPQNQRFPEKLQILRLPSLFAQFYHFFQASWAPGILCMQFAKLFWFLHLLFSIFCAHFAQISLREIPLWPIGFFPYGYTFIFISTYPLTLRIIFLYSSAKSLSSQRFSSITLVFFHVFHASEVFISPFSHLKCLFSPSFCFSDFPSFLFGFLSNFLVLYGFFCVLAFPRCIVGFLGLFS